MAGDTEARAVLEAPPSTSTDDLVDARGDRRRADGGGPALGRRGARLRLTGPADEPAPEPAILCAW